MIGAFMLTHRSLGGIPTYPRAMLIGAYAFAWAGHFFFEKNQPATFTYPAFSLMGDFRMWYGIASREIDF